MPILSIITLLSFVPANLIDLRPFTNTDIIHSISKRIRTRRMKWLPKRPELTLGLDLTTLHDTGVLFSG